MGNCISFAPPPTSFLFHFYKLFKLEVSHTFRKVNISWMYSLWITKEQVCLTPQPWDQETEHHQQPRKPLLPSIHLKLPLSPKLSINLILEISFADLWNSIYKWSLQYTFCNIWLLFSLLCKTVMFLFIAVVCFHCCIIWHCMNILTFIPSTVGKFRLLLVWDHYNNGTIYIHPCVFGTYMYTLFWAL